MPSSLPHALQLSTAQLIALYMSMNCLQKGSVVPTALQALWPKMLASSRPHGPLLHHLSQSRWYTRLHRGLERVILPGIGEHFLTRKTWIYRQVDHFVRHGGDLCLLGAGLDPLGLAIALDYPQARVVEYDRAHQLQGKTSVLNELKEPPTNLFSHDLDLTTLQANHLREHFSQRPTLCLLEGVCMYLPLTSIERLLATCTKLPQGSCLILSWMERQKHDQSKPGYTTDHLHGLVDGWLRLQGESFIWGMPAEDFFAWLSTRGWKIKNVFRSDEQNSKAIRGEVYATIQSASEHPLG